MVWMELQRVEQGALCVERGAMEHGTWNMGRYGAQGARNMGRRGLANQWSQNDNNTMPTPV